MLLAVGLRAQNKNIAYQDETVRFTVITDGAIRMEYAPNGHFVDNASQVAVIRDYPAVDFKVKEGKTIEITTAKLKLKYKKGSGAFTADNLSISSLKGKALISSPISTQQRAMCCMASGAMTSVATAAMNSLPSSMLAGCSLAL